jgi:hypothetical protein
MCRLIVDIPPPVGNTVFSLGVKKKKYLRKFQNTLRRITTGKLT